jgi:hypothetical protein
MVTQKVVRLKSGKNSKTDIDMSALYDRVRTIAEDYNTLLKSSIEMAKSGIALSEQMVDFVDYVEGTGGKGKEMKDKLLDIVKLADILVRHTSGLPSRIKEHLSYLSNDIQTKHDELVGLKKDRHSFNKRLKWMSIGIACLILSHHLCSRAFCCCTANCGDSCGYGNNCRSRWPGGSCGS